MNRFSVCRLGASVVIAAAFATACATPVQHATPSGKPEITVASVSTTDVKGRLVGVMMNNGYTITKDSEYLVAFDKPVTNVLAAALLGSQYDATPNERVQFQIARISDSVRVVADLAVITNPGSAFERRTPMNNSRDSMMVQQMLSQVAIDAGPAPVKYVAAPAATTPASAQSPTESNPTPTPVAAREPHEYTPPQFRKY